MPTAYLMCGKICSGKSTRARQIAQERQAVILSVDEITLALFGQDAGDMHDVYVARAQKYLYQKSLEILENGISVVLDWGFWTKGERREARDFYTARGIPYEFHYVRISDEEWHRRLDKRNQDVLNHAADAYYVDSGLRQKFASVFEAPDETETDIL